MRRKRILVGIGVGALVLVAAVLLWKLTPLAEFARPAQIAERLESIAEVRWAPLVFLSAYLIGGLIVFPVTVLSAATAIVFPPYKAVAVSVTGIMLSAAIVHWIGARFLHGRVKEALGRTIKQVDEALQDRGILTIAAVRMIPLAPFTLVNLAAGSLGVPFRQFMLGTAVGLAPGVSIVCLFGRQVRQFWRDPGLEAVMAVLAVFAVWLVISIALQHWAKRRRGRGANLSPARR